MKQGGLRQVQQAGSIEFQEKSPNQAAALDHLSLSISPHRGFVFLSLVRNTICFISKMEKLKKLYHLEK